MLEPEDVRLADADGRVLAETARSAVDLPPFPSSAMDGFALRAADAPGTLPVVARIAAGRPSPRPLEAGGGVGSRPRGGGPGRGRPGAPHRLLRGNGAMQHS